jgi:CRP-like cAMP-binding protein
MPPNAFPIEYPRRNKLLAALPDSEWKRVQWVLEPTEMLVGKILSEPGSPLRHAYFPTTSTISYVYATADGASTEIAAVGNEGVVGIVLVMGGETTPGSAVVQTEGWSYRLSRENLREEFRTGGAMQCILLSYTQVRLTLLAQTAFCNQHHSIEQRLIRWLLLTLERVMSEQVLMTHEAIANILGVRREGITEATGKLQSLGLIACSRRRITVIDRAGLEARCCECYGVVRREYDRLLGPRRYSSEGCRVLPFSDQTTQHHSADIAHCRLK